jgi:predicted 3-demethylubiquinone-9 3-methyltransferase (glyoxalase superfamily)
MAAKIKKIIPHLWFDNNAVEAVNYYLTLFPGSRITTQSKISDTPSGEVDIITFELSGNPFMAINAGPLFKFNEAISFIIYCDDQEEMDFYYEKLSEGGEKQPCGWVKDRFGLSWQVGSEEMDQMFLTNDKGKLQRVTQAMLKMYRLDLEELRKAYHN